MAIDKKRIVLFTSSLRAGGAERVVALLHEHLKDDHEVHLVLFENEIEYKIDDRSRIEIIDGRPEQNELTNILKLPLLARRLAQYCNTNEIDGVIAFLNRPNFVACLAKRFGLRAKVLISERAYTPLWYREREVRGKVGEFLTKRLYPLADAILPNSHGTKEALETIYGITNRYFVVRNPVSIDRIRTMMNESVPDHMFGQFTFICVARFLEQKNHALLINAFSRLPDSPRMILIGRGPLLNQAEEQVRELGIEDSVTFVGYESNPFKYVGRSDCFVLASNFEGFPNVLIEAMACGVPIISTDCLTGPRELLAPTGSLPLSAGVESGEYGLLVGVNDVDALSQAMERIMIDAELRDRLRVSGPIGAAAYDEDVVIPEFKEIISSVLGRRSVENLTAMKETQSS